MTDCVTPEETSTFNAPGGYTFTTQLEDNNSTTAFLRNANGDVIWEKNSGLWMACYVMGAGVGLGVVSYTGNPVAAAFIGGLTAYGCGVLTRESGADGDSWAPAQEC